MTTTEVFLIALALIFSFPWLLWRSLGGLTTLPLVVLQILGGVILGPGILGAAYPSYYAFVFRPDVVTALNGIAWWSVMLFVFLAGVELNLSAAWSARRDTLVTSGLALIVPLAMGSAAGAVMLGWPGWVGPKGAEWQVILGLGMACAVTALPILILFLEQLGLLRQPLGQRVLRYASLDDLAIWAVLAVILLDWERLGRQAVFLVLFVGAAVALRWAMSRLEVRDRWPVALIWLAAMALGADWAGLHYIVGAFLAGVVLDSEWLGEDALVQFRRALLLGFMPVFFLSTGLRTSWEMGGLEVFGAAGILLVASVLGKLLGVSLAGRILDWPKGQAWGIGWLLQTKALIMIIFANVLLDREIIASSTFTALLLMALGSTVLTMPIVTRWLRGAI